MGDPLGSPRVVPLLTPLFYPAISMHATPVPIRVLIVDAIRRRVSFCTVNLSQDDAFSRDGARRRAEITR